jgi:sugar phosphate isomerase/epimerase
MSATPSPNVERTIERCRTEDVTPVRIDAETLESTAPEYLRDLKRELATEGYSPSTLAVRANFAEDCSLATQDEADRIRGHVRAAAFLGASTVTVTCDSVPNAQKVRPALAACAERARREGLAFELDAPITLDDD